MAGGMGEEVAAHSVVGPQMADDRLDGGAAPQFALDAFGDAPSLPGDEHPGRSVAFQIAEVAIPRNLFAHILRLIADLRPSPVTSPA